MERNEETARDKEGNPIREGFYIWTGAHPYRGIYVTDPTPRERTDSTLIFPDQRFIRGKDITSSLESNYEIPKFTRHLVPATTRDLKGYVSYFDHEIPRRERVIGILKRTRGELLKQKERNQDKK